MRSPSGVRARLSSATVRLLSHNNNRQCNSSIYGSHRGWVPFHLRGWTALLDLQGDLDHLINAGWVDKKGRLLLRSMVVNTEKEMLVNVRKGADTVCGHGGAQTVTVMWLKD